MLGNVGQEQMWLSTMDAYFMKWSFDIHDDICDKLIRETVETGADRMGIIDCSCLMQFKQLLRYSSFHQLC